MFSRSIIKRFYNISSKNILNVLIHDTTKQNTKNPFIDYNLFLEFKSDIKYTQDMFVKMHSIMMGLGFGATGFGFSILYDKIEMDKKELNEKIDKNTIELNNINNKIYKINNKISNLDNKLDILINKKNSWF